MMYKIWSRKPSLIGFWYLTNISHLISISPVPKISLWMWLQLMIEFVLPAAVKLAVCKPKHTCIMMSRLPSPITLVYSIYTSWVRRSMGYTCISKPQGGFCTKAHISWPHFLALLTERLAGPVVTFYELCVPLCVSVAHYITLDKVKIFMSRENMRFSLNCEFL